MSHPKGKPWHAMTPDELCDLLHTDRHYGLTNKLAKKQKERYGENTLFSPIRSKPTDAFRWVLRDAPLMLLLLLCVVALCFSMWRAVICVLVILGVSITLTVTAHTKTQHIKESMSALSIPRCEIVRAGKVMIAKATAIVVGDCVRLHVGDRVPADVRLVSCDADFCVRTLRARENGGFIYDPPTYKNAQRLYAADEDEKDRLLRENTLFAGSVVQSGSATAIVVATGVDTYHGALSGPHALACETGEIPYLSRMRSYVNRYSLLMSAMLLPSVVIGLLFSKEPDLFAIFFTVLCLGVASMSEQLMVIGRIVSACGVVRAALPGDRNAAALLKKYAHADRIASLKHVILTDLHAFTDGNWHPYAVFSDEKMYDAQHFACTSVRRFYTLAYLYSKCSATALIDLENENTAEFLALLKGSEAMVPLLSFDTESIEIRTVNTSLADDGTGDACVSLRMRGGAVRSIRIVCTTDAELPLRCQGSTVGDHIVPMDEDYLRLLLQASERLQNDGCRLLLYATRGESGLIFEGMLALREQIDEDAAEKIAELSRHHVRVSLLLSELQPYTKAILRQSGLIGDPADIVTLPADMEGQELYRWYRKQAGTVFQIDSQAEVGRLMQACHQSGSTALLAAHASLAASAYADTDITITYDDTPFRSDGMVTTGKPIPLETYQRQHSARQGDPAMLAHADLLLRRTGARSGALDGLLGAVRTARAIERNMALMLQYMLVTQFLRMTPVLVALLFGNLSLSAPLILAGGLWVDLGFILLLAFRRGGEEELLTCARSERLFASPIRERPDRVLGAMLCGVIILLLRLILKNSLLSTPGADVTFVFLSLLTVQATAILLFYFGGSERDSRPLSAQLPVLGTLLLILLLPLLLLCLPHVAALCSCAPITLPILAAALVQALIYPALCYGCAALRIRGLRTKR